MKTLLALLASAAVCLANEQKQTLVISNKPLDIDKHLSVKQFDPDKGELTHVEIQARWDWTTSATDFEFEAKLVCPGPSAVAESFSNIETEDACCGWSLGVGMDSSGVGFPSYIGEGEADFHVTFTGIDVPALIKGSVKIVVTYTYTP